MAANCKHCDQRVLWAELTKDDGTIKRIPLDPKPVNDGDLYVRNSHPDMPLQASKATPDQRRNARGLFKSHTDTCPEQEHKPKSSYRDPSDPGPIEPTW